MKKSITEKRVVDLAFPLTEAGLRKSASFLKKKGSFRVCVSIDPGKEKIKWETLKDFCRASSLRIVFGQFMTGNRFSGPVDLSCLSEFKNLEELDLYWLPETQTIFKGLILKTVRSLSVNRIKDTGIFNSFPNLTALNLNKSAFDDFTPLKDFSKLRSLNLGGCVIKQIKGLEKCDLTCLALSEIPRLESLAFISKMSALEELRITRVHHVKQLPDFSGLAGLKRIYLVELRGLAGTSALAGARSLEKLGIHGCSKIKPESLAFLKNHPSLKEVTFNLHSAAQGIKLRKVLPERIKVVGQ